ncbi:Ig-like domain-containing protein [Janthinobacterium sp. RB2R34]|uniref:Ig-like domain-containing protein n=1 Tax=Janthinobacterium sp. RB2R34 TaxID=3424193 RepID=UPI003F51D59C
MRNISLSNTYWSRAFSWLSALAIGLLLAACGGGGGDPTLDGGSGGVVNRVPAAVSVALVDATDKASSALSSGTPLTAKALVVDSSGTPVVNVLVTFASDPALVLLSSTNGTALTDAKGVASITVSVLNASVSGAGRVTATVATATTPVSGEASYAIKAAQAAGARMTLSLLSGGSASNALSNATPLTARALVTDLTGQPLSNVLVAFSTNNALAIMSPSTGTALTNSSGTASVVLRPFSLAASGASTLQATATVPTGAVASGQINYVLGATDLLPANMQFSPASIAAYGTTNVTVDVLAGSSPYLGSGLTVDFSSACVLAGKASVSSGVPVLNGRATAVFRDLGCNDADIVTATVTGSASSYRATLPIGKVAPASIQFSAVSPVGRSIVIKGQGGLQRTETATLTFRVFDTFGRALAGQPVTFELLNGPDMTLNKANDTTDANGDVITTVNSGITPTTFRVRASLPSGVSTLSDTVLVSTGLPIQAAFSLSSQRSSVEGWSYDSPLGTPATIVTVLLADQAGNPVADGTPVSFQSNLGVVGSSSMGGCNTVNGGCSVDFRSQNPRTASDPAVPTPCNDLRNAGATKDSPRLGLATICASTTDGTKPLFAKIGIFLSDSHPANATLFDRGSVRNLNGGTYDLGEEPNAGVHQFSVRFSDLHLNPMPSGTTVAITNVANAIASITPSSIQNVYPHNLLGVDDRTGVNIDGDQGVLHAVTISSLTPTVCTVPVVSTFNVTVTTPLGNATSYPFRLTFSCP